MYTKGKSYFIMVYCFLESVPFHVFKDNTTLWKGVIFEWKKFDSE